ncbi:GL13074 [Drosophila persimilis]|uniref:GL13074 n=1 Tax=Drosophila persimilis TaxID=7234 RepID=B4GV10_DROPE|nr:GL13074 [Drosophila persimilis]
MAVEAAARSVRHVRTRSDFITNCRATAELAEPTAADSQARTEDESMSRDQCEAARTANDDNDNDYNDEDEDE